MVDTNGNPRCLDHHHQAEVANPSGSGGGSLSLSPNSLPNFEMITSTSPASSDAVSPMSSTSLPFGLPPTSTHNSESSDPNGNHLNAQARQSLPHPLPPPAPSSVVSTSSTNLTLPEILEGITKSDHFPSVRHRWNTNEEIAALLIALERHDDWLLGEVKIRPKSGSMMLYSRKRVRYRRDGYCWKKRKDGKTTREDHMKLKVQGIECIYGCYVHSAILPTFHRRCYWLLQNPDIVLVHYLNVPYNDDNKLISPSLSFFADTRKEWTREELIAELKPMFLSEGTDDHLPSSSQCESTTLATIESIVHQLMMRQRNKLARSAEADGSTPTTTTNANERKIATLTTVPALATNSQIINGSNPRTGKASGNGNSSTAKRDVHSGRNTTMTSSIQEDNAASSNSTVDVNGNVMQLAKSVTQHPPPQQTQTLQLLQLTSPQMCQLNATVTPASVTHSTDAPTHSLILSLSQLQAATGAGGQSFFILQQNSTTNHHHQVVPGTAATVSSTGNGTTAGTQTTPLTFIYGRPAETPKLQLSTVTSSATSSGQTFLTSHSQMTSQSENNNNRHLGGFRASQGVVHVKSEPEEEANDIEMTHAPASSRRFDLEDEKMICSEPSSPERYFTGNPLGPTDPSTSYGHLDADSISGLSTKDEPSSFDAFDSLFGNDSNLMNADPNFGSHYGSQADHSAMNTTTSDHHRQPSIVVHHRQSTATLNSTLHHSPDPIDSFMEATTEDDPTTADDILFSLDTFDIFGDFGNDPATDPGSTIHDLGDGTHTNNPNSSDTYSNGHSSSSGYHQTESGLAFPAAAANGQTASSQLGTGETAAATGNASGNKTRLGLLPMAAPDSCPIESTRSCGNNNQSGGNGPLVQQAVTVTMDENGNLQLVKAEKSTVQASSSLTTTRRAASAGHQGRHHQAANLHEITHKCSDSTLNDITDNEEFGLFTSQHQHQPQQQHQFSTPTSHAQNIRRQRHLSDMHTYHHQQQRPAETVHRPASRASSGRLSGGGGGNGASASSSDPNGNDPSLATIADYSPEWCYPEGGIKVLVAGPWYASQTTQYSIQFDGLTVPTELVQTGLLRCFSPKHDPGFVSLAVAANHVIISNSVIFEYRSHAEALSSAQSTPDYFAFDESLFRTTLLERCDKLNRGGVDGEDSGELLKQFLMDTNQNFEEALINFFETILDSASEITPPPDDPTTAHSHLTLLHLATALNLRALVSLLVTSYQKVKFQDLKNSWLLDQLSPTATDQHGSTPLAWAVALGHTELLELLLPEDEPENNVKNIPDSEFESIDQPVSVADGSSQQMTSEETRSTSLVDDLHFVSTLELDSAVNQFDLQSLDDLIHYLEEHERACTTDEHTPPSGHSSLASSLDDASPGTPTLLLDTYREVIRSPSNSSPSTSSEYSLESLESLESLPLNSLPTSGGASSIDLAEYFRNTTSELQALKLTSSTNSPEMATFEAAGTIQKAYRKYRGRRRTETAALTIQHYYRRYKQGTAYFRNQLTAKGARKCLPPEEHQHHHSDAKRFKTSSPSASACIETDDDTDESGMYTGTNSSDISMTNSTAQSDEEEEEGKGRVCQGLAFEEMSLKMAIHSGRSTTQNRIISP